MHRLRILAIGDPDTPCPALDAIAECGLTPRCIGGHEISSLPASLPVDLVLLMPSLDHLVTVRELRADGRFEHLPLLAVMLRPAEPVVTQLYGAGVNAVVVWSPEHQAADMRLHLLYWATVHQHANRPARPY